MKIAGFDKLGSASLGRSKLSETSFMREETFQTVMGSDFTDIGAELMEILSKQCWPVDQSIQKSLEYQVRINWA